MKTKFTSLVAAVVSLPFLLTNTPSPQQLGGIQWYYDTINDGSNSMTTVKELNQALVVWQSGQVPTNTLTPVGWMQVRPFGSLTNVYFVPLYQ